MRLFAFVTSFDEVIVVLFLAGLENTTIPIQMWVGLREQLSPTILAVATCLIIMSTLILVSAELLEEDQIDLEELIDNQITASITVAIPIPYPIHCVAKAYFLIFSD